MTPPARILRVFEGHGTVNDVDGRVLVEYAFSWCGEIYSELRGRLANRAACQVYLSSLHSLLARSHCPKAEISQDPCTHTYRWTPESLGQHSGSITVTIKKGLINKLYDTRLRGCLACQL